ncbi:DNA translocase FtsK [Ectobacillus sp. JY-23]|uniref:DNA translocase FtsK n=1 Tax=Ectobacillus sp. JY-23 TaxID=2933872 RepID=UPI001FF3C7B7|nr:DNA translocase FtsK [Ectobacillus sp. JY-23]UOY94331.1 DNA translocase FtsK [Ectobacillus sp. JY-23]
MLDWMKKLLNKEEQVTEIADMKDPVTYEKKQTEVAGKFRFPVIPDEAPRKVGHRQISQPVSVKEPEVKVSPQVAKVRVVPTSPRMVVKETAPDNKPFQPTEVISPVFGYQRPEENILKKPAEPEFNLSEQQVSVVDAWLIKNGFIDEKEVNAGQAYVDEDRREVQQKHPFEEPTSAYGLNEDAILEQQIVDSLSPEELGRKENVEPQEETMEGILTEESIEEPTKAEERVAAIAESLQEESALKGEVAELAHMQTESSIAQEQQIAEKQLDMLEEANAQQQPASLQNKEEPKREKKRFVPYNVFMLQQDKRKLAAKQQTQQSVRFVEEKLEIERVFEKEVQDIKSQSVVPENIESTQDETLPLYALPSLDLLEAPPEIQANDDMWLDEQAKLLDTTFDNFHVGARVIHVTQGPAVTRFEVQPEPGVKVNKITNLSDDIKLNLAARDIRIEAPIPGKNAVGIEVPNPTSKPVFLREVLSSSVFTEQTSPLTVALGLDISGAPIVTDLRKMPHGLIAGSTGSGKSVCINAILTSILYKAMPHEVKLLLIDPKMVELAPYNAVPHLVAPVITDVKAATAALKWAVDEMERRYELFAHAGVRDLTRYNDLAAQHDKGKALPYIVIVIDELADLMMVSPADVEEAICRIAQKARACGIHLLVATQRPSVDVITGLIKANIPTRIAFTVSSQVDSRTIIDISGAEKLLGRGDMLFLENGTSKPVRIQGVYVSDEEIERTVYHVKQEMKPNYLFQQEDLLAKAEHHEAEDELFFEACHYVLQQGGASTSSLQRRFRVGYNRAARLIEEMEQQGIISEARGTKPRDVLVTEEELVAMQDSM